MLNQETINRLIGILKLETALTGDLSSAQIWLKSAFPYREPFVNNLVLQLEAGLKPELRIHRIFEIFERPWIQGERALSYIAKKLSETAGESMYANDDPAFLTHLIKDLLPEDANDYNEEDELVPSIDAGKSIKVFISYAHADIKIARRLHKFLLSVGFDVWRDETHIVGNWINSIYDEPNGGLASCDKMVVLMSRTSMPNRPEVMKEWTTYENRKCIHPLLIEDCTIHPRLRVQNYIDARSNFRTALDTLVNHLKSDCTL